MITLKDAKQLSQDKLTDDVIDEFAASPLINSLPFDDTVKAQGGKSLTYSYNRVTTQPTAGTRAIGGDYENQEAKTTQQHANLKIMGGSYTIDRVIENDEKQVVSEVEFQSSQKSKATVAEFHNLLINGDSATDEKQFDGINKAVTGSTTEVVPSEAIDLSTAEAVSANYKKFLYSLRKMVGKMSGSPTHFLMNSDLYTVFQTVADLVPSINFTRDELGNEIGHYGSAVLVDMGDKPGTSDPIIANDGANGTSLYAIRAAEDGVHGVTPDGSNIVKVYPPNMADADAQKRGSVELVAAIAVKATKSVAALRKIKVA